MQGNIFGVVFSLVCLAATVIFTVRMRQKKAVHIYDYQTGVRFNGARCSILPPGVHFSNASSDPITVVDMRPHQFIIERQLYKDALLSSFVISLGGKLQVCDAQLAVTTLKNFVDDSLVIIQEGLRLAASHSIVDSGDEGRAKLASSFTSELNDELQTRGAEVQEIEITELWIQQVKHGIPTTTN